MKIEVSKRRQPLLRAAIYSLMTLSVIVIVTLLMLVVLGYSFNQKDGKFEQGGLLQFASTPQGAAVTLDEIRMGPRTNTKATVETGNHSVSFDRDGYRDWKKSIFVGAGQIGWLSYARLIPSSITTTNVRTFANLSSSLISPGHNYMLLHEASDQPTFLIANISGDTVQYKSLSLPNGSYTAPSPGKAQSFTAERWSSDEQAVLVRHLYDDNKSEWILLDRDSPEKSINVSATYAIQPSKIEFAGGGHNLLFVQTDDIVRRIKLDDQTLSRPIATRVESYVRYDDKTITYTTTADEKGKRTVGYAAVDIEQPQVLATYPADGKVLYGAMSSYFNNRYVSILHGQELKIVSGTLPRPDDKGNLKPFAKQTIPEGAQNLVMSRNGRFAVAQLPDGYAVYDLDLMKYDKTTWAKQPAIQHDLHWLDDYMVWSDAGGMLRFYEFDGANQQNIMPVTEGFSAGISPNDKYVYGVSKTEKGFEFKRSLLILP